MQTFTNPYLQILHEITPTPNYIPTKEEYMAWYKKHYRTIKNQSSRDI